MVTRFRENRFEQYVMTVEEQKDQNESVYVKDAVNPSKRARNLSNKGQDKTEYIRNIHVASNQMDKILSMQILKKNKRVLALGMQFMQMHLQAKSMLYLKRCSTRNP